MNSRLLIAAGLITLSAFAVVSTAQVKKGKTRPLTTAQLMSAIVKPEAISLGADLKKSPSTDDEWAALATKAALLNESSYILMADGRCPDEVLKAACDTLRDCSEAVLEKIEAQDAEGAQKAVAGLMKSCRTCHQKHREQ